MSIVRSSPKTCSTPTVWSSPKTCTPTPLSYPLLWHCLG